MNRTIETLEDEGWSVVRMLATGEVLMTRTEKIGQGSFTSHTVVRRDGSQRTASALEILDVDE